MLITAGSTVGGLQTLAKENTFERLTALMLATTGAYSIIKDDQNKGKIKKGFYVGIIILDKDYLTISEEDIKTISSLLTLMACPYSILLLNT